MASLQDELVECVYLRKLKTIKKLLRRGARINGANSQGITPLLAGCLQLDAPMIKSLATLGADVNASLAGDDDDTLLFVAAQNGNVSVIEALVELGADVNAPNNNSFTPVLVAAQYGHVEAIRVFAKFGGDVNFPNNDGITPIYIAAQNGHVEAIKALVKLGANVNTPNSDGATPLFVGVQSGHVEVVKALPKLGANVNTPANNGATPVHIAAHNGNTKVIKALYKLGADMKPTSYICSIAEVAEQLDHPKALQLIVKILNKLTDKCEFCGCSSKRLKRCATCLKACYCSSGCQLQDWRKHKKRCSDKAVT